MKSSPNEQHCDVGAETVSLGHQGGTVAAITLCLMAFLASFSHTRLIVLKPAQRSKCLGLFVCACLLVNVFAFVYGWVTTPGVVDNETALGFFCEGLQSKLLVPARIL